MSTPGPGRVGSGGCYARLMIECDGCGFPYDGTRHRWLCPRCKLKSSCCEGAPCYPEGANKGL